ncbi:MAG: acetolactate synthase small subunit [Oceanococcus sp.]
MRHIISVLLANEAGALSRVAGLFSARGYNIESLTVAPTQNESVSRLTLVTTGSDEVIQQINKQLKKLVDVVDLADWTDNGHIEREVMLLKLKIDVADVDEVAALAARYGAQILDDQAASMTLEFTGTGSELNDFRAEIESRGDIIELVRSGATVIACGEQTLKLHG